MSTRREEVSDLKIRLILAVLTLVVMVFLASAAPRSRASGVEAISAPRVTSITQVTHDGFRKTNLLADDSQLFVTELPAAERVIAKVSLAGSNRTLVSAGLSNLRALDLSPDHTRLLVSSTQGSKDNEFWTLPVAAGSPQRLGDLTGRDASWSADGKQLVFGKGKNLFLSDATGAQSHEVYRATGPVFAPRFSPDGQRIRFTVSNTEQNTTALWEVGRDGSNPRAMLKDWPYQSTACCGNWTADGRYYIFQATQTMPNTTSVVTTLWALPDGGEEAAPVELTNGPMSFAYASSSRDGKNVWAIGVRPEVEIVKYEPGKKKFVPVIPGLSATDLDYSADGKWVAYVAIPEGTLWRARANGSDRMQLTSGVERSALPRWSPDGKQIAFVSMRPGESWKLALIDADGGVPQQVVEENGSQIDANWSADGSKLMFGDFAHDAGGLSIRVLDFKTRKMEKLPGSDGLFSPRWSPDGRYVAALSPDNTSLLLFDYQTQKWTKWITASGSVNYPVWSADSKYLYYDDLVDDAESIRRVKVTENQPERVVEVGSLERYMGALGVWSGRSPDGSWLFVRDRSTQEVYQLALQLP